jgi:phenylalanyl-tRNA synthetase beta chain
MHPGRCARVLLDGRDIGFVGELHPRWRQSHELAQAPQLFELDLDAVLDRTVPAFSGVSKFQAVQRDIAVILPEETPFADLLAAIRSAPQAEELLRDVLLFDVFRPAPGATLHAGGLATGEKSLAVRITLNSDSGTLTEARIDVAMASILACVSERTGARLR